MQQANSDILHFAGFQLSPLHRKLTSASGEIALRAKSLDVLIYLATSSGRVVPKTELLDAIWPDVMVSDESLERCISDIRAALSDHDRKILKTVARRGYILAADVERVAAGAHVPRQKRWAAPAVLGAVVLLAVTIFLISRLYTPRAEHPPLLAVLPIQNSSGLQEQNYFTEGLTEDITSTLTRLRSIGIVASGSSAKFKDSKENLRTVGKRLGAAFLLTGSLQRSPSKMALSLQLVNVETGAQVWSDHYDGTAVGFVEARSQLVKKIATILDAHITKAELDRIAKTPAANLNAYDFVLQGNALMRNIHLGNRGETIAAARERYQSAATADPRSSQAAEGLANNYLMAWLEPSPGHPINKEFQSPNALQWAGDYARQAITPGRRSNSTRQVPRRARHWAGSSIGRAALQRRSPSLTRPMNLIRTGQIGAMA